jgi:hypothetical protein
MKKNYLKFAPAKKNVYFCAWNCHLAQFDSCNDRNNTFSQRTTDYCLCD